MIPLHDDMVTTVRKSIVLALLDVSWYDNSVQQEDLLPAPGATCNRCNKCCKDPRLIAVVRMGELLDAIHRERFGFLSCLDVVMIGGIAHAAIKKENGRCVFHDDVEGCKIHDIRPSSCRVYPESMLVAGIVPACDASCFMGNVHVRQSPIVFLTQARLQAGEERVIDAWGVPSWNAHVVSVVAAIKEWVSRLSRH